MLNSQLSPIPAKRYFTIGEVSELCGVKAHVLRYWESEFPQLKPLKRGGNRRYYQRHEVLLIRRIRELLYEQGFTIVGARNQLGSRSSIVEPALPFTHPDGLDNLSAEQPSEVSVQHVAVCEPVVAQVAKVIDTKSVVVDLVNNDSSVYLIDSIDILRLELLSLIALIDTPLVTCADEITDEPPVLAE